MREVGANRMGEEGGRIQARREYMGEKFFIVRKCHKTTCQFSINNFIQSCLVS